MGTTVAIVAAEPRMLERCSMLVRRSAELDLVATATRHADLAFAPDVTVIACPSSDPGVMLAQASLALSGSRLVVIVAAVTRHAVRRAIRGGAAALVREDDVEEALVVAIRSADAGQLSIPLDFSDGLEKPILSSREKQILGMVVMGFTNGQIGRRLFLAESTVKSHMSSIFSKLGVGSRKEAAALVLDPEQGFGLGILSISDGPADPLGTGALTRLREETAA